MNRAMKRFGLKAVLASIAVFAAGSATASAAAEPFFVPAFEEDFADPFVIVHNGRFLAYSTNRELNLPMAVSRDLVTWERVKDPDDPKKLLDGLPKLGVWAKEGLTWAPEVMEVGGKWLLYYTARDRGSDKQCLGLAVADEPTGPFRDTRDAPFLCQIELGGTIDANPFRDADGKLYLYYKNDGNAARKPSWIWGQRLSDDGLSVQGEPVTLIRDDKPWEFGLVEAPTMVRSPAGHRLLYSAAFFGWNKERLSPYATGYAVCTSALGPCKKADQPILNSYSDRKLGCLSGPGHTSVFQAAGRSFLAFHAWAANSGCRKAYDRRYLYIAPFGWTPDGKPLIGQSVRKGAAK
jgi:beta-xylosidase